MMSIISSFTSIWGFVATTFRGLFGKVFDVFGKIGTMGNEVIDKGSNIFHDAQRGIKNPL